MIVLPVDGPVLVISDNQALLSALLDCMLRPVEEDR